LKPALFNYFSLEDRSPTRVGLGLKQNLFFSVEQLKQLPCMSDEILRRTDILKPD
jgi:hypothetical protein